MRYEFYLKVGGAEKRLSAVYAGIDYVTVWRYAGVLPENAVEQRFAHVAPFDSITLYPTMDTPPLELVCEDDV